MVYHNENIPSTCTFSSTRLQFQLEKTPSSFSAWPRGC